MAGSYFSRVETRAMAEDPLWLVVLCDIMTNLMLFFLVLYAFTRQPEENRKKFLEGLVGGTNLQQQKEERAEKILDEHKEAAVSRAVEAAFQKPELKEQAEVQVTDKQIRMRLQAPVLFKPGESELSAKAKAALDPVGKILGGLKEQVIVEGYTDDVPISKSAYRTNWELSIGRARSVMGYLAAAHGIPENRFVIAGYGEFRPLESNKTSVGRAHNRRIEIVLVRGGAQ